MVVEDMEPFKLQQKRDGSWVYVLFIIRANIFPVPGKSEQLRLLHKGNIY